MHSMCESLCKRDPFPENNFLPEQVYSAYFNYYLRTGVTQTMVKSNRDTGDDDAEVELSQEGVLDEVGEERGPRNASVE